MPPLPVQASEEGEEEEGDELEGEEEEERSSPPTGLRPAGTKSFSSPGPRAAAPPAE